MKCAVLAVLAAGASVAVAGPAITSVSGGSAFGGFYGGALDDVVGFRFTADVDMFVTDLGIVNDLADGVLDARHTIGLWRNSDQALLASVTVDSSGTLISNFYYESIGSVMLSAGGQYTLGATYNINDGDSYVSGPSLGLDGISGTTAVFPAAGDLGFVYPTEESGGNQGRIGPNMIWEPIPAPASLAALGLAFAASSRRRR